MSDLDPDEPQQRRSLAPAFYARPTFRVAARSARLVDGAASSVHAVAPVVRRRRIMSRRIRRREPARLHSCWRSSSPSASVRMRSTSSMADRWARRSRVELLVVAAVVGIGGAAGIGVIGISRVGLPLDRVHRDRRDPGGRVQPRAVRRPPAHRHRCSPQRGARSRC